MRGIRGYHALCLTGALLVLALVAPRSRVAPRPRNLLLITLDTMRADRLPSYGFEGYTTPAISRIAEEGMVVQEAFAAVPLTLPSHASMLTGIYPPRLGIRDNADGPLSSGFTTLAEALRSGGLATAAFVASAVIAADRGLDQGFDLYSGADFVRTAGSVPRRRAGKVIDDALPWLESHRARPFFVWIHLFDTHRPYDLPDEYKDRHFDPYLAAIMYEDAQIARLVRFLEERKLLDSTLIVIAGDHGESLGDHGEEAHGIFIYQEALRVPLIFRGPGITPGRLSTVTRLVDVMPTILDMFDMPAPGVDGVSLLRDEASDRRGTREVYSESMYPRRFGWAPLRSLRADRYKLIEAPRMELYDLVTDPAEQRNIYAERLTVAASMLQRLRSLDSTEVPAVVPDAAGGLAERLASLGYVSRSPPLAHTPGAGPADPKDRIHLYNKLTSRAGR